jgi:hypothetical protein
MYAQDSIELLKQSGIDFAQNETRGIDVRQFGELLTVSGVVLNEDVSWLAAADADADAIASLLRPGAAPAVDLCAGTSVRAQLSSQPPEKLMRLCGRLSSRLVAGAVDHLSQRLRLWIPAQAADMLLPARQRDRVLPAAQGWSSEACLPARQPIQQRR